TNFDPLQYAVPEVYTDEPVKITMRRDASLNMKGQDFILKGETEVPEFLAIFLRGRKMADIGFASENEGKEKLF
ncbi:MAG: DNA primase catalytic subunit PriS, partial [Candidatus Methanomethylophilaceae archaeon]|nr:DNA primase catalytic subunit PriS [Candidatus Methanomethylophilaceae archaeon]